MTPREIITKEIMAVKGIRIPFAKLIVERIFTALSEYGYTISETTAGGAHGDEKRVDNGRCGACQGG